MEENINYLANLVDDILNNGYDKSKIESILNNLMAKDDKGDLLLRYIVRDRGQNTAIFIPRYKVIEVSISKLQEWLNLNSKDLMEMFNVSNKDILDVYLLLMVLMHEVEHSNQYLISKSLMDAPCTCIKEAYVSLIDLLIPKDYILPRPILFVRRSVSLVSYKLRENEFLLERNAQIGSLEKLADVAFVRGDIEIREMFVKMKNIFATLGYKDNCDGALINTFKDIYMGDKLKKFTFDYEDMDMMERYRLGLPIDQETRSKVLSIK